VGTFDPTTGNWFLRSGPGPGAPDAGVFAFGGPAWTPVVGDWNGDGTSTVGVVDPNAVWSLRNENSPGAPDIGPFAYGEPGWIPVVGDWSGTGHTGIGMFDPGSATWYLRNEDNPGPPDAGVFRYGSPGWAPVVGDWRGDGRTSIGVVDPSTTTWYLRDSPSPGAATIPPFAFGSLANATPVVGDWFGHGTSTVGMFNHCMGNWHLRNENSSGPADAGVFLYGAANWSPVSGHLGGPTAGAMGMAERAPAGARAATPGSGSLTEPQLQQTVSAALTRLQQAGVGGAVLTQLQSATYQVGQFAGPILGRAYPQTQTVVLDANAAGYGWFVDPTPLQDEEFARDDTGALAALPGEPAAGRMDLLTVVLHEMGHLVGNGDLNTATHPNSLMDDTLALGLRRTDALATVFAEQ
jgi:hypothetical protein